MFNLLPLLYGLFWSGVIADVSGMEKHTRIKPEKPKAEFAFSFARCIKAISAAEKLLTNWVSN